MDALLASGLLLEDGELPIALLIAHLGKRRRPEPRLSNLESGPVRALVARQDDLGYEKYIRFNRQVFSEIAKHFSPVFARVPIKQGSASVRLSTRKLTSDEYLFLLLRLLAGRTALPDLCVIAGITQGALSQLLSRALIVLLVVLRRWHAARIRAPSVKEAEELDARVTARYPCMEGFIGFADGIIMTLHSVNNMQEQSRSLKIRVTLRFSNLCIMAIIALQLRRYIQLLLLSP